MIFAPLVLLVVVALALVAVRCTRRERVRQVSALALPIVAVVLSALTCVVTFPAMVGVGGPFFGMALASALALGFVPAVAPRAARPYVAALVIVVVAFITLSDVVYWRFFGGLMPLLAIGSASHIGDVGDSISALLTARDLALAPVFVVGIVVAAAAPRVAVGAAIRRRVGAALVVVTLAGGVVPVAIDVDAWLEHRFSWKVFKWTMSLSAVGLVGAHARDIARSAREIWLAKPPTDDELRRIVRFAETRAEPALASDPDFGRARGMNLLVVQVEAMQAFVVDAKVGGEEVMPFLSDAKRTRARVFTNLWDQTGGSPTSDCEYLVMNGLHPLAQGAVAFRRPGNDFVALPSVLGAKGYDTFSAHAYDKGMWNRAVLHPRYGFSRSAFSEQFSSGRRIGWGLGDEDFFKRSVTMMEELKEPFFTFLITLTSHHPYKYIPKKMRKLKVGKLGEDALAHYLHSMRYVDDSLRALFAALESAGLAERTVVAIYGDHDSKLTFSAKVAANAERELGLDAATAKDLSRRAWRTKKIPLFVFVPGDDGPRLIDDVGGQIDIGPTLLHLVGVEKPRSMIGRPLTGRATSSIPRFVARTDGAGADLGHVLDVESGAPQCLSRETGELLDESACAHLVTLVQDEIAISERMTLENIARQVADAPSPPPRAPHIDGELPRAPPAELR